MGKLIKVIAIIAVLYLISSLASKLLGDDLDQTDKIAVVPIKGVITTSAGSISPLQQSGTTSKEIIEFLEKAEDDKKVKAIVLDINSPGGTVVASREVAEKVKEIEKPTVAVIRDVGASGAYWIATASDLIVADPLSITGSVGVIASYLEFSELFDEYGITYQGLKAGELKDMGSPFKTLTSQERSIIQKKLDRVHEHFIDEVVKNRELPESSVSEISTGVYFLGEEALELGLIDEFGNKADAIDRAEELAEIEDSKVVEYEKESTLLDVLTNINAMSFFYMGKGIGAQLQQTEMKGLEIIA